MKREEINVELKVNTNDLIKKLRDVNRELDKIRGEKKDGFDPFIFTAGIVVGSVLSVLAYIIANI